MRSFNLQSRYKLFIFLGAFATALLLGAFLFTAQNLYQHDNRQLQKDIKQQILLADSLIKLNESIGYGGLIHNFKNYLLRGEAATLNNLQIDIANINRQLKQLNPLMQTPVQQAAYAEINRTLQLYISRIDDIVAMRKNSDFDIHAADKLVRIDDHPALQALNLLANNMQQQIADLLLANNQQVTRNSQLFNLGWLLLLPVIAFAWLSWVFIGRLQQEIRQRDLINNTLNQLLNTSPDALIFTDTNGQILRVNAVACELFGYSETEFSSLQVEDLVSTPFKDKHRSLRQNYLRNPPAARFMNNGQPILVLKKDQTTTTVQIRLGFVKTVDQSMIIASVRDVSQSVADQTQLKLTNRQLASTIKKLQYATESLVESEKMAALGSLVAGIAHEINTPIGVCLTASTHLDEMTANLNKKYQSDELKTEEFEAYVQDALASAKLISVNIQRAAHLINNFKQIAVDQSNQELRDIQLCSYIHETVLNLTPAYKHRPIKIEHLCAKEIAIKTDPGAISQIITNLLMNCLEHAFASNQEGLISIRVAENAANHSVIIAVKDNGKGMSEQIRLHAFEPFFTTDRAQGGSGLGLHIVFNLVNYNLKGKINVVTAENQGSEFIVEIPIDSEHAQLHEIQVKSNKTH